MIFYLFKKFLSFFKRSILNGIFQFNQHLLILDGDGCFATIEAIKHAQPFGLYMIPCFTTTRCELFQVFQNNFQNKERQCNGYK